MIPNNNTKGTYNDFKSKPVLDIAHAPYNFVSPNEKVFIRYKKLEELPKHSKYSENLKNGSITFTLKAETPIMISGANSKEKEKEKEFIKNSKGEYIIPGSTLKGLIRTNMTVLGMCSISDYVENGRFLYRTFADKSSKLRKEYTNRVGLKTEKTESGKTISRVENVKAGYIYKVNEDDYRIIPAVKEKDGKTYFRVSEKTIKERWSGLDGVNFMYKNRECTFRNDGYTPYEIKVKYEINYDKMIIKNLIKCNSNDNKSGFLTCAGFMNKKMSHYVVLEQDKDKEEIIIHKDEIRVYKKDLVVNKKDKFYALPEKEGKNNARPIFYAEYNKKLYFGYTPYLRIFYDFDVKNGLSTDQVSYKGLDYTKSIFGFTDVDGNCYKGRVSVEDAKIDKNAGIDNPYEIVLANPKSTCFPNYLDQPFGTDKNRLKSYNDEDFRIRGIKNYWLKDKVVVIKAKDNVNIIINPLKAGSTFKGKIYFENLAEDELGLLLWSLTLNENCQQNLGLAKVYGFGRVKIMDVNLKTEDLDKKYKSFSMDFHNSGDYIEYIGKYKEFMKVNKVNVDDNYAVKELMLIKTKVQDGNLEEFKYMVFDHRDYKNEFAHRPTLLNIHETLGVKGVTKPENIPKEKVEEKNIIKDNIAVKPNVVNIPKVEAKIEEVHNPKSNINTILVVKMKCVKCGNEFGLNAAQKKALDTRGLRYPNECTSCRK